MKIAWIAFARIERQESVLDAARVLTSDRASIRYRLLLPAHALRELGYESCVVFISPDESPQELYRRVMADVLVVTKLTPEDHKDKFDSVCKLITLARADGKPVVVDVCDDHFDFDYFRTLVRSGDFLVAPTAQMAETARRYSNRPCVVIPDPYEGHCRPPRVRRDELGIDAPLKLLWYGVRSNLPGIFAAVPRLALGGLPGELQIVSDGRERAEAACAKWNRESGEAFRLRYTQWSAETMYQALENCDAVVVPASTSDPHKRVKSPNRVVEAIQAGRFVVASPLPSYREFARYGWIDDDLEAGLRWMIAQPEEALARIIAGQAHVEKNYAPAIIAQRWHDALNSFAKTPLADRCSAVEVITPLQYSRAAPSERYRELLALYARMHVEGETHLGIAAEDTFPGGSLLSHVGRIKRLIDATGARTILDYGAGKGLQYRPQKILIDGRHVADGIAEFWDVDEVRCYDPGYAPHAQLPEGQFDGVVCTDVLEHCPERDVSWILDELLGYARKFAYLNVACYPARKSLPSGENAHVTVRPPEWWHQAVAARVASRPGLIWELHAAHQAGERIVETVFQGGEVAGAPSDVPSGITSILLEGRQARFATPNEATRWRVQTLYAKEPVTIEWLRAIPRGAVLLDVGANVGMYTVFAALAREARVFAFEPESQNFAILNENLRLNGLGDRVLALCAGLSDRPGIERLYLSEAMPGGSCHSLGAEIGFDLKPRPAAFVQGSVALRFDDLVSSGEVPIPEYVKVDVDGLEHKVLRGMSETLRNPRVRSLIVELNPQLAEHREIRDYLGTLGFGWNPVQVESAARKSGPFIGVAEHVFSR